MLMHPGQVEVAADDVARAVAEQVPELAGLPIRRVESAGTVVAPFRIGEAFAARVPLVPSAETAARAALVADADHAEFLAGRVPVEVPRPVAVCEPFDGYAGYWSVWTWVDGVSLDQASEIDPEHLPRDLANLLLAFHRLPAGGAGWNGAGRGGEPLADTEWVRDAIAASAHLFDPGLATDLWERALAAPPHVGPAVFIHGDPMPGNFIVRTWRLAGMVDIAGPVFGDPASDLAPAWTLFDEPARTTFRAATGQDAAAWERGRGWAFEMAILGLAYYEHSNPAFSAMAAKTLARLAESC